MARAATVIGHLTRDTLRVLGRTERSVGGTAYYSGLAYARLGLEVTLISKVAAADEAELTRPLRDGGCALRLLASRNTTCFENTLSPDQVTRTQRVRRIADAFTGQDLPDVRAAIVHLGPLTAGEMTTGFLQAAAATGELSVLDVQGLVRRVEGERVVPVAWHDAEQVLPRCTIVKADGREAALVTGVAEPEGAARALVELGAREALVTLAERGAVLAVGQTVLHVPAIPPRVVVDTTGAGDAFCAGYAFARGAGRSPPEAAHFAAALASLSVEQSGAVEASLQHVLERMAAGR